MIHSSIIGCNILTRIYLLLVHVHFGLIDVQHYIAAQETMFYYSSLGSIRSVDLPWTQRLKVKNENARVKREESSSLRNQSPP